MRIASVYIYLLFTTCLLAIKVQATQGCFLKTVDKLPCQAYWMGEIFPGRSDSQLWKLDHLEEPNIDKSLDFTATMVALGKDSYAFSFNIGRNGSRRKKESYYFSVYFGGVRPNEPFQERFEYYLAPGDSCNVQINYQSRYIPVVNVWGYDFK